MSYNQLILLHKCLVRLSTSCLSVLYGNHNTHQCITEFTPALVTADPNITTGLRDNPVAIQSGVTDYSESFGFRALIFSTIL